MRVTNALLCHELRSDVADQLPDDCRASIDRGQAAAASPCENFLYVFKGAERAARLAARASCMRSHITGTDSRTGGPARGRPDAKRPRETVADGRGHPALAPPAHSGPPRSCSLPGPCLPQLGAVTNASVCARPGRGHPPGVPVLNRARSPSRALRVTRDA